MAGAQGFHIRGIVDKCLRQKHQNCSVETVQWLQVPLKAAIPFLEGALRAAAEKRRNSSIVKSLRRSENLQLREEVIKCRQRYSAADSLCICQPYKDT